MMEVFTSIDNQSRSKGFKAIRRVHADAFETWKPQKLPLLMFGGMTQLYRLALIIQKVYTE
jgi:hypothetical protein